MTATDWVQLDSLIVRKIAERYDISKREITENARGRVRGSGPKPLELSTSFRLARREDAERWVRAMRDACLQFLAEHGRLRSPNLWEFLLAVSKDEVEPRIRELLNDSFRIPPREIELIERWRRREQLVYPEAFVAQHFGTWGALNIAIAKRDEVDKIIHELFGWSGERPFAIPSPTTLIDPTPSPDAQPVSPPVPSPVDKPTKEDIGHFRVNKILQAEREIAVLRPLINSPADYEREKGLHPDYITIKAAGRNPELKELLLGIQGHTQEKAQRFAKQVAASECGKKLNTIEKAWDLYKPESRRIARKKATPARSRTPRKSHGKK